MAITKTENDLIGTATTKTNIAASGSATSSAQDVSTGIGINVSIQATYDSSATAGVKVLVLTSPDNSNFDTDDDAYAVFYPSFTAGATVQATIPVGPEVKYFKVKVVNLDGSYAVSVWVSDVVMTN